MACSAHNKRHQKRALWALDSQQVARVCSERYKTLESGIPQNYFGLVSLRFTF